MILALIFLMLQVGSWRDQPPIQYQREVTVTFVYTTYPQIAAVCRMPDVNVHGCYVESGRRIYLPLVCSPTKEFLIKSETVNPQTLGDSYCDLLKKHELGHAAGWPSDHSR